jgi:glycosyltransferase involved in cell wall biosynthesis
VNASTRSIGEGRPAPDPRILGLVEGDPATALSGVARFLLNALDRRFHVVERLDYSPKGIHRFALASATFRPSRDAWRARFHTSRLAHEVMSRTLARRLPDVKPNFDLALQVHGWVRNQPRPYALYIDQTRLMAERGWREWLPFTRRERSELLRLETEMYRQAFHLFVMGTPARDSLVSDYGVEASRISVVGGGLPFEALPTWRRETADATILFVGREFERKGGDCLLRAFERVRERASNAKLHIVGPARRIDSPGVITHGRISDRDELATLYREARVFCLPSRYEPYGLALIEAMAHGVPCVATNVQSIPEILDEGRAGVLVPPDDPAALADALLRMLVDDAAAAEMGAAGRREVERRLTWEHVVDRMSPALSELTFATR